MDIDTTGMTERQKKKVLARQEALMEEQRRMEAQRLLDVEEEAEWGGAAPSNFTVMQPPINMNDRSWQESRDISIQHFSISAGGKRLLDDAELRIQQGVRYGLIGPNGQGKSTLLKMIATRELHIPPRIRILYVEQEVFADETPAYEAVLKADKYRIQLMSEEKLLEELLDKDNEGEAYTVPPGLLKEGETLMEKHRFVQEEINLIGIEKSEAQARRILSGLGFDEAMQNQPTNAFSGGWRMRISLARALFIEPDLLLLDEPTNHLDLNAVLWLDEYLQRYKKTLFVVSHDQDFLSSVCNFIIHLFAHRLNYYHCDYHKFKSMEAQHREQMLKEWEKQQKELKKLKAAGKSRDAAEDAVKTRQNRKGALQGRQPIGQEAGENKSMTLLERPSEYLITTELRPPIMEVTDVSFNYPGKPELFTKVNFGIDMSSRISMVGPNGCGKSTLLKLVCGDLEPTAGEIRRAMKLRIGRYSQHFVDQVPMDQSPVEYLTDQFKTLTAQDARNLLGRYGLEGHAHTIKIKNLSGGQKSRVVFADISLRAPHILIFDEPTNNLDIESIDALGDAIRAFEGGVVIVSHDARLLSVTECRIWKIGDGGVEFFPGSFEDYRRDLIQRMEFDDDEDTRVREHLREERDRREREAKEKTEEEKKTEAQALASFFKKKPVAKKAKKASTSPPPAPSVAP